MTDHENLLQYAEKYVDDLEISFVPESSKLQVRSESRVGESDLGVNQKRIDLLKSIIFR